MEGKPLTVHGYGVELALKRTDYIVIDDRDKGADDKGAKSAGSEASGLEGDEEVTDLKPLSKAELEPLGLKAGSFILNSADPLATLVKLTQDFPKHSARISSHNASEDFLSEWRGNTALSIPPGYNIMWINGLQVDSRQIDPFSLLEHVRRERKFINSVRQMGFSGPEVIDILSHEAISSGQSENEPQRYDFRDTTEGGNVIMWLNNIEKDKRYEDWPTALRAVIFTYSLLFLPLLTSFPSSFNGHTLASCRRFAVTSTTSSCQSISPTRKMSH